MSTKTARSKKNAEELLFEKANVVISSLEKFATFLFLYKPPYQPILFQQFRDTVSTSFDDKLRDIKILLDAKKDPLPSILNLLKDLVCWDILYRRFRFGITRQAKTSKKTFLEQLEIKEDTKGCFKRLEDTVVVATDQSEKEAYVSCFNELPYGSDEMFAFYSVTNIEKNFITNKTVSNIKIEKII
jgi:hypothetical protein